MGIPFGAPPIPRVSCRVPELPEVEVLVRHLRPLLKHRRIRGVSVLRPKIVAPSSPEEFAKGLRGRTFDGLDRRGKYLVFSLRSSRKPATLQLLGHLGMTGRMYLLPAGEPWPKHAAVVLRLDRDQFVFEDTRYFGRLTLDLSPMGKLGPEPLERTFSLDYFIQQLQRSSQPIKVKLLDQTLVAGVGNIYASEILFRAGVSPKLSARKLTPRQAKRVWVATREVLTEAIQCGSTVPLSFGEGRKRDSFFYFGRAPGALDYYEERLLVYDRADQPCSRCGTRIRRLVQAGRSTFFCPRCQSKNRSTEPS
jgi:formamidopyrimidine-DNA glycosylase